MKLRHDRNHPIPAAMLAAGTGAGWLAAGWTGAAIFFAGSMIGGLGTIINMHWRTS